MAAFKAKDPNRCCKTCAKVLAALEAGRPVYSGYEDPDTQDRGARVLTNLDRMQSDEGHDGGA